MDWTAHKSHWINPVLNNVPIRLFDALVTGGIPIVPYSLRSLPPVSKIPRDQIVFYGPEDIISPDSVAREAVELFDQQGKKGVATRHLYALNEHHAAVRLAEVLRHAGECIGCGNLSSKLACH